MRVTVDNKVVKHLLGGKWPDDRGSVWEGFSFDSVDHWVLEVDELGARLVPMDGGAEAPGPDIWLVPVVNKGALS